jgi:urease accessory protein
MNDASTTLRLLAWLSPAFPTGGFAYSHGIEWAVEAGDIRDGATLLAWVEDVLRHGAGRTDAILLRRAHAGAAVIVLARAAQPSRERLAEATAQGGAFERAAFAWRHPPHPGPLPEGEGEPPLPLGLGREADQGWGEGATYPVAVGRLAGAHGIDVDLTCAAYLQAFAANLISAAVRLVPLGQSAGLAVLAALEPTILAVADATRGSGLDDIGGSAFRSDIAAMRHETQYTRLFRS